MFTLPLRSAPARSEIPALPALTTRRSTVLFLDDRGAATAEYAIATMAAVAFAGLLVVIMRAEPTKSAVDARALVPPRLNAGSPMSGHAPGMTLASPIACPRCGTVIAATWCHVCRVHVIPIHARRSLA